MGLDERDYMRSHRYAARSGTRTDFAAGGIRQARMRHSSVRRKFTIAAVAVLLCGILLVAARAASALNPSHAIGLEPAAVSGPNDAKLKSVPNDGGCPVLADATLFELRTSDADLAIKLTAWMPMLAQISGLADAPQMQTPILRKGEFALLSFNENEGLAVRVEKGIAPYAELTVNPRFAGAILEEIARPWIQLAAYSESTSTMGPADRMRLISTLFQVPRELRTLHAVIETPTENRLAAHVELQAFPDTWTARILDTFQPGPRRIAASGTEQADILCAVSFNAAKLAELPPLLVDTGLDASLREFGALSPEQLVRRIGAIVGGRVIGISDRDFAWDRLVERFGASGAQPNSGVVVELTPAVLFEVRGRGIVPSEWTPIPGTDTKQMRATVTLRKGANALNLTAVAER